VTDRMNGSGSSKHHDEFRFSDDMRYELPVRSFAGFLAITAIDSKCLLSAECEEDSIIL